MTDAVAESTASTDTAVEDNSPTITLDTDTPVEKPEVVAPVEKTPEEIAAEDTRRAALTDDERKAEDDAKLAAAPKAPAEYADFTVPDGVKLQDTIVGDLKTVAKDLDLPQEAAQKIVDLGIKLTESINKQQADAIKTAQSDWAKASRADKEFGGDKVKENIGIAETAIKEFTSPEYRKLLKDSGLGNHPEVIRTFYRIGKALQSDKTVVAEGTDPNSKRSETPEAKAARLYGTAS